MNIPSVTANIGNDLQLFIHKDIKLYFGESIALYFQFLGYYTSTLFVPVFLGFLQLLVSSESIPFFCVFNVVWVTLVLEISGNNACSWTLLNYTECGQGTIVGVGLMIYAQQC
ncbi:hypothetical protein NQ317_002697 [Molorchus minor]|uniref:Anoctamin n=1 Tax=Molorchus minor TaxID=1323400 RepID=A0ABQ9J0T9_9CUCU|nr:hypothetical protein NQ317_002697 [Molorchus minor]